MIAPNANLFLTRTQPNSRYQRADMLPLRSAVRVLDVAQVAGIRAGRV